MAPKILIIEQGPDFFRRGACIQSVNTVIVKAGHGKVLPEACRE